MPNEQYRTGALSNHELGWRIRRQLSYLGAHPTIDQIAQKVVRMRLRSDLTHKLIKLEDTRVVTPCHDPRIWERFR